MKKSDKIIQLKHAKIKIRDAAARAEYEAKQRRLKEESIGCTIYSHYPGVQAETSSTTIPASGSIQMDNIPIRISASPY